jgi:hypothetical protein
MTRIGQSRLFLSALVLTALSANTSAAPGSASPLPPARAEALASALAAADAAAHAGDNAALRQSLRTIRRLGAKPMTDTDKSALGIWETSAQDDEPPLRGRTLGPAYRSGVLGAGQRAIISQTFYGGAPANVSLQVATGSALRLRISDPANRNICEKAARQASCQWLPLYTQMHRIEVVNERAGDARYYIVFD